jgi:hypothetical protein
MRYELCVMGCVVRPCILNQSLENRNQLRIIMWVQRRKFLLVYRLPFPRVITTRSGISYLLWAIAVIMHIVEKVPVAHMFPLPNV